MLREGKKDAEYVFNNQCEPFFSTTNLSRLRKSLNGFLNLSTCTPDKTSNSWREKKIPGDFELVSYST